MAEGQDRAAAARAARARKREEARRAEEAEMRPDPRLARTPVEREQARVDAAQSNRDLQEAQRIRVEQTSNRPFAGDVTGTHGVPAGKPSGRKFTVQHGAVGPFVRGAEVHESMFHEDTDFDRLLALGALKEVGGKASKEEEEAALLEDLEEPMPETLTEAAYSENKPTMPRVDGLDTDPEEVRRAMAQGVGTAGPREEQPEAKQTEERNKEAQGE